MFFFVFFLLLCFFFCGFLFFLCSFVGFFFPSFFDFLIIFIFGSFSFFPHFFHFHFLVMGLFAHCDMLRSSTHSRACLAMCLSGQSCARIAAWLKLFHLRVRLVCPAFALLVGLMLCFRGVLYVGITWLSVAAGVTVV